MALFILTFCKYQCGNLHINLPFGDKIVANMHICERICGSVIAIY